MPPHPAPAAHAPFSVAERGWIDVRTGPHYRRIGLHHLLRDAHLIDDLATAIPPAASALLRIAVAITARVTGLDDPDLTIDEWNRRRRQVLDAGRLDPDAVHAYFSRDDCCWDAFDPHRPWLQDPALRTQSKPVGINKLLHRPAGNNLSWFTAPGPPTPAPVSLALQHLLVWHFYGDFGRAAPRTIGSFSSGQLVGGPLRATVSYHPHGRTLFETLVAGCPPFAGEEQLTDDYCPWERPPADPLATPDPISWPGRLLTGRSRHALLLLPDDTDPGRVADAHLTWALPGSSSVYEASDPYLVYAAPAPQKGKDGAPRRKTRADDSDRAWWRELDTLLLAPDEEQAFRRPDIFSTLNDLPEALRRTLRVRVHGFHQDPTKCINLQWYTALTPPLLHWTQEHDPQRAQRIATLCRTAEELATALDEAARTAWKESHPTPPAPGGRRRRQNEAGKAWVADACARYWPAAERQFWRLLERTDDHDCRPAFACAAADALRATTRSARIRHPQAARAVARAARSLHLPHAPERKETA